MEELEWLDFLDEETGVFRYYGDNGQPGNDMRNTRRRGNLLLEEVFDFLNSNNLEDSHLSSYLRRLEMEEKKFLGLATPGNGNISQDRDLVSF